MSAVEDVCNANKIQVVFVYLAEAHSADSWPLTLSKCVPRSHQDTVERLSAAQRFFTDFPKFAAFVQDRWYLDSLDNSLAVRFGLWPERYVLLDGQRVCWCSTLNFEERFTDIPQAIRDASAEFQ